MVQIVEFTSAETEDGARSAAVLDFFAGVAKVGVKNAIPNLSARLGAIVADKVALPFAVSVDGGGACYLSSFTRMYMDGAADEFGTSDNRMLRLAAPGVAAGGQLARALGMDDIVTVNNNLYPTNHVGDWSAVDVGAMTAALVAKYPRHALWVRGLNDHLHKAELARLTAGGYLLAPSRPVEILDPTPAGWKVASNVPKDLTRMKRLPLKPFVDGAFSDADFAAMERFSRKTTVEHHSKLMPHYTAAFFRACTGWADCRIDGLRDNAGNLHGFATMIIGPERITCGSMGYDLDGEHAQQIYRALNALQMEHAIALKRPYNVGYGATAFKRLRGTEPAMETNAFYVRHLPMVKRSMWQTSLSAMSGLADSVMKRL